ncbi:hypothetical protein PIB30_013241 [Stylosanthes scabra]|uniref:RING-type domain-containing protein n=1 Tax=Stylosanthes scabra TaxID=79078 RepID=A0ABU6R5A6_9FABA|nr:hypothetical protein [Stylosanthes scabra]
MNCLLVCQSPLWIVTIVFYTCILIPLMQLKKAVFGCYMALFLGCEITKGMSKEIQFPEIPSLPVARFQDLKCLREEHEESSEETCSICLVEFEDEDAVSKLRRCNHIFHLSCIEQWIDRNQFSCPLCRSFLFTHD